ncbi:MAG: hypothetical protein H6732_16465 [Alphaproteobacteria bacterium]|nr:hypothetical protein [Alphaproteobacteria bacterium]
MLSLVLVSLLGCDAPAPPCAGTVLAGDALPCTCGSTRVDAVDALPATCTCTGGAVSCEQPPADDPASADLPTPFSAAQIRQGMPKGLSIRLETSGPSGVLSRDEWVVTKSEPAGVDIRYTSFSAEGKAIGGSEQKHDSWDTLEGHARFPRERATRERATVETRLGSFEGWKYVVTETEEGAEGSPAVVRTSSYWFADALPGAPVRMVVEQGGTEVVRMEQVSRKGP